MKVDVTIWTPGRSVADVLDAVRAVEDAGFHGVSFWDQLSGLPFGESTNLEAWTLMSAAATVTTRVDVGSLVLNMANRDAGTLAIAAATLAELSAGRFWMGLGAGTGPGSPYAQEQEALGRQVAGGRERRQRFVEYVERVRATWEQDGAGFLLPRPAPRIAVGCFGRIMARTAGTIADAIAVPLDGFGEDAATAEELFDIALEARSSSPLQGRALERIVHTDPVPMLDDDVFEPGSPLWGRLERMGADRLVVVAPAAAGAIHAAASRFPL